LLLRFLIVMMAAHVCAVAQSPQDLARDVLAKYLAIPKEKTQWREIAMDVDINAALPKMKKHGTMKGLRRVAADGAISYEKLAFDGDEQIKKDVIVRYLTGEQEARTRNVDAGIHERNYKIGYKARLVLENKPIFIFKLEPRRKADGLIKGELWLDGDTGMPLRETGRLVRSPSIFFKKTEIVRRYEVVEDRARLAEMTMQIETRIVGKVEMAVKYGNYQPLTPPAPAPVE
jgi:hypothetical protein